MIGSATAFVPSLILQPPSLPLSALILQHDGNNSTFYYDLLYLSNFYFLNIHLELPDCSTVYL